MQVDMIVVKFTSTLTREPYLSITYPMKGPLIISPSPSTEIAISAPSSYNSAVPFGIDLAITGDIIPVQ